MERALTFGSAAEAYERFRPGYPDDLVDRLRAPAEGVVTRAIEVGAGTGKATRVVAAAGIEVTAVEPDARMLAILGRTCAGLPVHPHHAAFEDVDAAQVGRFDLLYAAAAWHWTRPEDRWDRASALVRPGGAVAFFGGPIVLADAGLETAEEAIIRRRQPAGIHVPPPSAGVPGLDWPGDELAADGRFTDVRQERVRRRLDLTRDDYLGHLSTVSALRILSEPDRAAVLEDLAAVLPDRVAVDADLVLHTARRR